jgi:hypothetical protein
MNITNYGRIDIPKSLVDYAETIKLENYKVNTPTKFQINTFTNKDSKEFIETLSKKVDVTIDKLDYVFFSVCKGAVPHTDDLNPEKFTGKTYVIPIILPKGDSVITSENQSLKVELNGIYKFDHRKLHSMLLEDNQSGCVVIMVGELQ